MDIPSLHSLGSSYYPSFTSKPDNLDKDFKKSDRLPLPPGLNKTLPFLETPWKINDVLFKHLQFPPSPTSEKYHKVELTSSDPETAFVYLLFNHSRPRNLSISKIYCLHNRNLTKSFESELAVLEDRAKNSFFAPNLEEETDIPLRKRALQRWKSAADQFSPICLDTNPRNPQTLTKTYVLPLWHGTTEKICESIANDGFAISSSHAFKQGQTGDGIKTDVGFFDSGIYFTNSAHHIGVFAPQHRGNKQSVYQEYALLKQGCSEHYSCRKLLVFSISPYPWVRRQKI